MERNSYLKLNSTPSELNRVVEYIENICDQHNIYNSYYGNIVTGVTEAFLNAVEHGNKNDSNKSITINFEVQNDGFAFCVSDEGNGFDINTVGDPTDINSKNNKGRGIYLMKHLSDDMEFHNGGRTACMKFLISSINKEVADSRVNKFNAYINQAINQNANH